jgi:hypothetical protein
VRKIFTLFFKYNSWLLFAAYCGIAILFMKLQDDKMLAQLRTGGIEFTSVINEKLTSFTSIFTLKK